MNKWKRKVLKVMSRLAEKEAQKTENSGLPLCIGYIYQPKRPKK